MGSTMDSRYWVCPHCFSQLDWEVEGEVEGHNCRPKKQEKSNKTPISKKQRPDTTKTSKR
jgi:hypothetical protein